MASNSHGFNKYYRLYYTLFAAGAFIAIVYFQMVLPSPFILGKGFSIPGWVLMITGAILMLVCIRKYFVSLTGLKRIIEERPVANELRVDGVHRYVRHPLYLGTFLFIWGLFLIIPHLSLLISNLVIHIYTLIGIKLEEDKLIDEFGASYLSYKQNVPKLIPRLGKPKQ